MTETATRPESISLRKTMIKVPQIMLVDDNIELLEELESFLLRDGYQVQGVCDGAQVFEAALRNKPDIVVMDLKMSPKTGFEIADQMRNSLALRDVPIIAMTGFFTEKQHVLMMKLCGIRSSILKPFNPFDLVAKIEFLLGNRVEEYK